MVSSPNYTSPLTRVALCCQGGAATLVDDEAQFLDGGQVAADSIDAVHLQT